ncbi:MAG: tetratricopeptide repeat protein, partial [Bacteroidales bacterium]|nr:tetratricopeptide repeat protein [Bacteroidales bacterium]
AEEWYQKSIELGRDKSWTYYWLGKLYMDMRRYEAAVNYLSKALQKYMNHKFAHLRLAKTYEVLNKPGMAKKHYQEVLRIEPNNQNALKAIQNLKN